MDSQLWKVRITSSLYSLATIFGIASIGFLISFFTSVDFSQWIITSFSEHPLVVSMIGIFIQELVKQLRNLSVVKKLGGERYIGDKYLI